MIGRFVWRVKMEHASHDAYSERRKPIMQQSIDKTIGPGSVSQREVITLGRCPYASDVVPLVIEHVLGKEASPDDWNLVIHSIESLGWGQGASQDIEPQATPTARAHE